MNTKGFFPGVFMKYGFGVLVILHLKGDVVSCGETCDFGGENSHYCEYGCCSSDCCSYSVSKSVLIVAGIIGGLIMVALVVAIVICLVKTYRDKRAARVRQLRPEHHHTEDHIPRRPAEPRKPPEYMEQPPPYSSEMPESHYRPVTVAANYFNYNTRYRTPAMQNYPRNRQQNQTLITNNSATVHGSQANQNNVGTSAGRIRVVGELGTQEIQQPDTQLPGTTIPDRPPTYTEQPNNQTEAQRRRRFIQTPPRGPVGTGGANTTLRTVSELTNSDSTVTNDERSETRQSSVTTQNMIISRSDTLESRTDTVNGGVHRDGSRQHTNNRTSVINTQVAEPNNTVLIGQVQTQSDLNSTQNARTPQTHRSSAIAQSNVREHAPGHTSMESAVSRARSRQTVTTHTPQRSQAISIRHADNLRTTADANNSDIEELACL